MKKSRQWLGIVCLGSYLISLVSAHASDTNGPAFTNTTAFDFQDAELSLRPVKRYEQELIKHQGVVADRFGPPSDLEWTRRFNNERYIIHDHINSIGASTVAHLVGDSLRETAVALLPVEEWKSFGELLVGSIGNTAEERTETISASFSESEHSWSQELEQDKMFHYGLRPWRADPYGYFVARVGHWGGMENLPFFIFEGRAGYKLFNSGKLEGRMTVPLPNSFQLVGGISTDPLRLGSHNISPTVMSARLEYVFRSPGQTKVMYVGAASGARETLLATGFIFDW